MTTKFIPPDKLPNYGFVSQAMQCKDLNKYTSNCWTGCASMASLKFPDVSKTCPRKIKNEFVQLFHID